jgi:hypothetical protein
MSCDDFDTMAREFTVACQIAANWKDVYFGARYSTRIKSAIEDLERAIEKARQHPKINPWGDELEVAGNDPAAGARGGSR